MWNIQPFSDAFQHICKASMWDQSVQVYKWESNEKQILKPLEDPNNPGIPPGNLTVRPWTNNPGPNRKGVFVFQSHHGFQGSQLAVRLQGCTGSIVPILSLKLTSRTWKWMVGRWSFPFGVASWQVRTVSFRKCAWIVSPIPSGKRHSEKIPMVGYFGRRDVADWWC